MHITPVPVLDPHHLREVVIDHRWATGGVVRKLTTFAFRSSLTSLQLTLFENFRATTDYKSQGTTVDPTLLALDGANHNVKPVLDK